MLLEFIAGNGAVLELEDRPTKYVQAVEGFDVAPPRYQVVPVPGRDGEVIVSYALETRYVRPTIAVLPTSVADYYDIRRDFASKLNPRLGAGTLRYQPVLGGAIYEIGAVMETPPGFGKMRRGLHEYVTTLSFRCPDPALRQTPAVTSTVSLATTGLLLWIIPWVMPAGSVESAPVNAGDLPTYPVLTFTAGGTGATNPEFTNVTTGQTFRLDNQGAGFSMAAGEELVIDMGARTAYLEGVNVLGARSADSEAWPLVPGTNEIATTLGAGGGETQFSYYRRYVGV